MLKDQKRKTSRAAILPFPGDPFLFKYWYTLFLTNWGYEVDKLYIIMNSPVEPDVYTYIEKLINKNPKVHLEYIPNQIEHGLAIDKALNLVQEEYIMLIEDDGFIWGMGVVAQCFNLIECGAMDIVGSKRGSCGLEILQAAQNKWGLKYEGEGDQGPNFWPNFFFCKKELLTKTDRNFGAKHWAAGETIPWLDHKCTINQAGDTFVNTSLQLRTIVPEERIHYVPQYHGHPHDIEHYDQRKYLFDGKAPWCHIGSLSSGIGGLIQDDVSRPLARRTIDPPGIPTKLKPVPTTDFERQEYERRVQWWDACYWFDMHVGLAEFKRLYREGIDRIIRQFGLDRKRIKRRQQIYANLINGEMPR